jgi:hypothetical protein
MALIEGDGGSHYILGVIEDTRSLS